MADLLMVREATEDTTLSEAARMEVVLSVAMQWDEVTLSDPRRGRQFWSREVPQRWQDRVLTPRSWSRPSG